MNQALTVRVEWLDAPGVTTLELASTWARYEIWVADTCVTQVEDRDGTFRRSIYGSLYPLAEWIAANWWVLLYNIRPSAVDSRYWTWSSARTQPWLVQHNLRAAGDGMAWPNLTLVPEGDITRIVWVPDQERGPRPVRFASLGTAWVRSEDVAAGLATVVEHVLDRLVEAGLPKTRLSEEWAAVGGADDEEAAYSRTVARLGLDPYAIDDQTASKVLQAAERLPQELRDDFFDNADSEALDRAATWTLRAVRSATAAAARAANTLELLHQAVSADSFVASEVVRPWTIGYRMARRVRQLLGLEVTSQFDISPWIGRTASNADSAGIQGIATVVDDRCGLVQGESRTSFGQARALGRALARPERKLFMLSAARSNEERLAGAFAAELLAPADGIRKMLEAFGGRLNDAVLDAVARQFSVSPLLIRHQYDNQLANVGDAAPF